MNDGAPATDDPAASGAVGLADAAERLGVHYMTAYRYVRTGRLDARHVGGRWEVDAEALRRFRAGREEAAAPPRVAAPSPRRTERLAASLADRLVAGDEPGSWKLVEDRRATTDDPAAVYVDLLGGAMHLIGERWAAGDVSVADEHRATVVAMRLVGRLGAQRRRRGRTRGTVVLSAAPGDRHALPTAIVADLLRGAGVAVTDLGADTPGDQLARAAAATDRLVAVGICATTPLDRRSERELRAAIQLVHEATDRPVLLGGAAVASPPDATRLRADLWTADAGSVVASVAEVTGATAPRPRSL